ncbi:unnamed protein product [Protopolystoma xenopodis]|uniref:Uncharacterized protein n=1 Tax=Protopolystoma xenopodis TaxID=117903 RepID=A0A448XLJ5_9PLAT|nr:unnamed protein product [Protopolystoma xenopodis]
MSSKNVRLSDERSASLDHRLCRRSPRGRWLWKAPSCLNPLNARDRANREPDTNSNLHPLVVSLVGCVSGLCDWRRLSAAEPRKRVQLACVTAAEHGKVARPTVCLSDPRANRLRLQKWRSD